MNMNNLTPEQIDAILQSGEDDPQAAPLRRQQMMADQMQKQAMTPQDGIQAGNVYRAAPAWSPLLNAGMGAMAGMQQKQVDAGQQAMAGRNLGARRSYMDAMVAAMRRPRQQIDPAASMPPQQGGMVQEFEDQGY